MAIVDRGVSREKCFISLDSLSLQTLQEDGMKVLIVWFLIEAKGADIMDKFAERNSVTTFRHGLFLIYLSLTSSLIIHADSSLFTI